MGKPKAPAAPDYAAAATAQGLANSSAAVNQQQLNQVNQVTPDGSINYSTNGYTTGPDGTQIPNRTATTTLSAGQQKLYDQNMGISSGLNDLAAQGLDYVGKSANTPFDLSNTPLHTQAQTPEMFNKARDETTAALMSRLRPELDRTQSMLDTKLANQGITQGSEAYNNAQKLNAYAQNDAQMQVLLAGNAEQNVGFQQGLASDQFANQTAAQNLQQQIALRNQPLNTLNALRTGNQASVPQFQVSGQNNSIDAAPVFEAAQSQYQSALDAYKTSMAGYSSMLSGLGSLGGAAITGGFSMLAPKGG